MANRIIQESIRTSPDINALPDSAELFFYRLWTVADDHGCFEADPLILKGCLFPIKKCWTPKRIARQFPYLISLNMVALWTEARRLFGIILNWDKYQRIRSLHKRKTPEPKPDDFNNSNVLKWLQKYADISLSIDVNCRQVTSTVADCRLNPNPNPNPNPNLNPNLNHNPGTMSGKPDDIPYQDIISHLNEQAHTKYKWDSSATKRLIRARWNEGYRLEDFKRVHENKVAEWKGDANMMKYLRPSTLYAPGHFEEYLQQVKRETLDERAERFAAQT